MAALQELTDSNFKDKTSSGLVMIDFWAPWCAPCRMIAPILEELDVELSDKASIMKLNVDENPQTANEFSITSIPTLLVMNKGEVVERTTGAGTKEHYKSLLNKYL